MSKLGCAALGAILGLAFAACSSSGGSPTPGTGGSATGGAGTAGTTGNAGTTGTAGATGTAGTTGTAGASAGTSGAAGNTAGSGGGAASGSAGSTGVGGTTGGAGRGGAGASGGGGTGGATTDPCATALFCDDFESYTAGAAPTGNWTRQVSSGSTAAVDTTQFRSGTKSVKFVAAAGTSKTAYIRLANATGKTIFPVTPNGLYGRMMFRLESAPSASVHWTFVEGSGLVSGQNYHALYRYGGQLPVMNGSTFVGNQLMANYETPDSYGGTGPSSDCYKHASKVVVPTGMWSCAEWQFDGPTNTMRFWLDGAAVDSLTVTNTGSGCVNQPATYTWTAPTFDRIDLGWESYQQDTARTIWIDDVVISKTRVGCPTP